MAIRRFLKKRVVVVALAILAGGFFALTFLMLRTPDWYAPPTIADADRQNVRDSLIAAEQAFTKALREETGPFTYHIYQDDLNRWIAMRSDIYPLAAELTPPQLEQPFIDFDEGRITVGGRIATGPTSMVVSLRVTPVFENGAIVLKSDGWRCGSAPLPEAFLGSSWIRPVQRDPGAAWPGSPRMSGDLKNGVRIDSNAWWKNGGVDYRVVDLAVAPGVLNLRVEPLGPHFTTARNNQP